MARNRRRSPRFSIPMWNCFSRVDLNLPRTNNDIEGWHHAFHVSRLDLVLNFIGYFFLDRGR